MTLTQKILTASGLGLTRPWLEAGDVLEMKVDWTLASELSWAGMERTYDGFGRPPLPDRDRFFLAVDHTVDEVTLATDRRTQRLVARATEFARAANVTHFYGPNTTILHTKFYRELVRPGQIVVGADSHTTSHGAVGAFAIGLGGADVVMALLRGKSWLEVPEAIAVEYQGALPLGLGGKDVVLRTLRELGRNGAASERTVEYRGEGAAALSVEARFAICNMTAELGGINGIFEADSATAAWLARRMVNTAPPAVLRADENAPYVARHLINLRGLAPQVARPFSPDNVCNVEEVLQQPLDGCFIGACTTTEEDLVLAGLLLDEAHRTGLRAQPADPGRRIVVPGDISIRERLREAEIWTAYQRAGFVIDPPGCSMCLGIASRKAGAGEIWLSSQNRNFPNRMGPGSVAWLASAPTVAASALAMSVTDPRPLLATVNYERLLRIIGRPHSGPAISTMPSEPAPSDEASGLSAANRENQIAQTGSVIGGRVQRFGESVDTDAIIPAAYCHLTTPAELGEACFKLYRPDFRSRVAAGATIVVAEDGWGCGSSREHAVWALQGSGVKAVIARSIAFIHRRNMINEGLVHFIMKDDAFFALADEGCELEIEIDTGRVTHIASGRCFQAQPQTPFTAEALVGGGLVATLTRQFRSSPARAAGSL